MHAAHDLRAPGRPRLHGNPPMSRSDTSPIPAHRREPLRDLGVLRSWGLALLAAGVWFEVLWLAARAEPPRALTPVAAAAVGLVAQLGFTALEASLAVAAWLASGARVRWSELAPA